MKRQITLFLLAAVFCLLSAGCQESTSKSTSDRRAQLVGNENIQLKKQLQAKDQEIQRLKNQIQTMEQQAQQDSVTQGETYSKLLEIVADLNRQIEECKAGKTTSSQP